MRKPVISISIVSHGQTDHVIRQLKSLQAVRPSAPLEIILTENLSQATMPEITLADIPIHTMHNQRPKGFAANHNAAIHRARGEFIAIANPDLIYVQDVFPALIDQIRQGEAHIVAPLIVDQHGHLQDSYRPLPSPLHLLKRALFPFSRRPPAPQGDSIFPEWISGIFLYMRAELFRTLGGLDDGYWLYFEDVDFCTRARLAGYRLMVDARVKVIHQGQRASHRDPRYFLWHSRSAWRFFRSTVYREARRKL
jgi:hypothetical protein